MPWCAIEAALDAYTLSADENDLSDALTLAIIIGNR
jgi:hypothetical protein